MLTYNGSALRVNGGTVEYTQTWPAPMGNVTIGDKSYPTVYMPDGNVWMAVNLDLVFTGLSVPTSGADNSTSPQAMYYNYDESIYGWNGYKCGLLYNWYAVKYLEDNKATLCPGWHVPTRDECLGLLRSAGGGSQLTAGQALKAIDGAAGGNWPSGWGGMDTYGFKGLPTGYFRDGYNGFEDIDTMGIGWLSTEDPNNGANAYAMFYTKSSNASSYSSNGKRLQMAVRLVKDSA